MLPLSTNRGICATINCGFDYLYNPLMEYKEFAKNLKELQSEKGFKTQHEFAKYIGVSKSFISVLLLGEKLPSMDTAIELCKKFNVSLDWLMTGRGSKRPGGESAHPLHKEIAALSPEQQAEVANFVQFVASKAKNKPLTKEPDNVGGGG